MSKDREVLDKIKGKEEMKQEINLTYSMPAGLLIGTVIAVVTRGNIPLYAGIGMLLGVVIGTTIDYEMKNK